MVRIPEILLTGRALDRTRGDGDIQGARQAERAGQIELDRVSVDPGEARGMDPRVRCRPGEDQVGGIDAVLG